MLYVVRMVAAPWSLPFALRPAPTHLRFLGVLFVWRAFACTFQGDGDSRFGRGGVIDDVLLTGRDDFEGEPFSGSLGSSAFRK